MFLVSHVMSQDQVIKGSCDLSSWEITNLPGLVAVGTVVMEV